MRARLALVSALVLLACDSDPASRVVVSVDADESVRARAATLRLHVQSDDRPDGGFDQTLDTGDFAWPARTTLVPRDGDASRTYRVEATARGASGEVLAIVRAISGFVPGETRELVLRLEGECLGVTSCSDDETCEAGACIDAHVEPSTLPAFGDAGVDPPGDGGMDAGRADACAPVATYADSDDDGYGDPATLETRCTVPAGRVLRAGDCDDACPTCHPEGVEQCDGTRDEDCDGTADEGCACSVGATRACPGASDVGACESGSQTCVEGVWSVCAGRVDPLPETCDGVDEDCDGRTDEGVVRACEAACGSGTQTCRAGTWQACSAPAPRAETCNGADDDCDGTIDERVLLTFYRDADSDTYGAPTMTALACRAPAGYVARAGDCDDSCRTCLPGGTETCDGRLDEDCDGTVDESCACRTGASRPCPGGSEAGECAAGTQVCSAGAWGTCSGQVGPAAETCNARDDDCDMRIDEQLERSCGPASELGVCVRGTESCSAGVWQVCQGAVMPGSESCNALDDDCDGRTDEGVLSTFYADGDGDSYGVTSSAVEACARPSGYAPRGGDCDDARPSTHPGAAELCDGIDQDCDDRIDEGASCTPDAGPPDAGPPDAGPLDAGPPDPGSVDAGALDAGRGDGG